MYCLKPKLSKIPSGDWYCHDCKPKERVKSPKKKSRQVFSTEEREEEQDEDMDTTEANESDNDEDAAEENSSDEVNVTKCFRKISKSRSARFIFRTDFSKCCISSKRKINAGRFLLNCEIAGPKSQQEIKRKYKKARIAKKPEKQK